jgi:hypothetical protein
LLKIGENVLVLRKSAGTDMSKPDDVKHQIYIDERKSLVETEQTIAHNFDKNIFALAAGALGLSLAFLEKIIPKPNPETLVFLYISWFSLVLSLLATLSSLLIGQYAFRRARDILESEFFPSKETPSNRNICGIIAQILNWSSIAFFIIGVSTLVLFSVQNMKSNFVGKSDTAIVTAAGSINAK